MHPTPRPPTGTTRRVLLAASGGGHLRELLAVSARVTPPGWERAWLVPRGSAGAVPAGEACVEVPDTGPRDLRAALAGVPGEVGALVRLRPTAVLSTGAALAVPLLLLARARRIEAHYLESAARTDGPSMSGRLVERGPGVHCYMQWDGTARHGWSTAGSVFDGYRSEDTGAVDVRRVVVTLGTQRTYGFRRLVEALVAILPPDVEVLWQTGSTDTSGLGIEARPFVGAAELEAAMAGADVVVAHAGIGSVLTALGLGRCPVLVPREHARGEHVDDHQGLIGRAVGARNLAVARRVEELRLEDLVAAARRRIRHDDPGPLVLAGTLGEALRPVPTDGD